MLLGKKTPRDTWGGRFNVTKGKAALLHERNEKEGIKKGEIT